jgi:outer membrane protein with beta-barrel domain
MNRALLAVTLLASAAGTASAGTYLGLGIGTAPAISDDSNRLASDSRSGRLLIGSRFGNVAIEGAIGGFSATLDDLKLGDVYQASGALKLSVPLGNDFEAFGRAGLHHTWVSSDRTNTDGLSGNGFLVSAGFEYRLNAILSQASIFVDYSFNKLKLANDNFQNARAFDGNYRMWTVGLTVGL